MADENGTAKGGPKPLPSSFREILESENASVKAYLGYLVRLELQKRRN